MLEELGFPEFRNPAIPFFFVERRVLPLLLVTLVLDQGRLRGYGLRVLAGVEVRVVHPLLGLVLMGGEGLE